MRLFISGASGLLGCNLSFIAASMGHEVLSGYNQHKIEIPGCKTIKLDLLGSNFESIKKFNPDCIIHCAALTNIDLCETNKPLAWKINVDATKNIARVSEQLKSRFIFISTDSVFDGETAFHKEEEKPSPLNFYAETKVESEKLVRTLEDYVVVRTNFYGFNIQEKESFSEWLYNKMSKGEKTNAFTNFYFSPILANNLANAVIELASNTYRGTLHIAGQGRLSKYEFALKFANLFSFDRNLVVPAKMDGAEGLKAIRPKDCSLDISKAIKLLKTELLDIDGGLLLFKKLFDENYKNKMIG